MCLQAVENLMHIQNQRTLFVPEGQIEQQASAEKEIHLDTLISIEK